MQRDISTSSTGGFIKCLSPPILDQKDGFTGYTSINSPIFPPRPSVFSLTPSNCSTNEETNSSIPIPFDYMSSAEFASYLPRSHFLVEHHDLVDLHNLCLSHLHVAAKEAEDLRQENINLRMANIDLNKRLNQLIQASVGNHLVSPSMSNYMTSSSLANDFRRLCIREPATIESGAWDEFSGESPTSVIQNDRIDKMSEDRVSLPKSISIRPDECSKTVRDGGSNAGRVRASNRIKKLSSLNGTQKVYVDGGNKEEQPVEMDVYHQGTFKTELCNKWQETGACPYGNNCQFAHGIAELRPILRHPRYKTELCRMVLAGDPCLYGHRCHFRHALTDEEKLMISLKSKAIKPDGQ